jgi:hypothetical protein
MQDPSNEGGENDIARILAFQQAIEMIEAFGP